MNSIHGLHPFSTGEMALRQGIAHRDLKPENVLVLDRSWEDPMVTPQARPETSRAGQDLR